MKQTVLIVDDTPNNIKILIEVLRNDYALLVANSGIKALEILQKPLKPDIVILDVNMPGMDGYEVMKSIKQDKSLEHIPVIFVTANNEVKEEEKGLSLGAVDYITKPYNSALLKKRINNQLNLRAYQNFLEVKVSERTKEISETQLLIIQKLGIAIEYKDNDTGFHIARMSNYCKLLAIACGLPDDEVKLIYCAAPMHDIGKIGISDKVLLKPGKLTEDEYKIMQTHSEIGKKIIGEHDSPLLKAALIVAYEHHERWDGKGYPCGIKGEEIHLFGRIAAVADVFDALTSKRCYKNAWSFEDAYNYVLSESGKSFDPRVVNAFTQCIPQVKEIWERYSDDITIDSL